MRLPSLNAVRAFEAVARHGSFSKAADELAVTHGAVSRQVRSLEQQLGVTLLHRTAKGAEATLPGETLARAASQALATLRAGVAEVTEREDAKTLSVSLATSLALKWLVPRLPDFRAAHPEISILLDTNDTVIDLRGSPIDVALRLGDGSWSGVHTELLARDELVAVASPNLVGTQPLPLSDQAVLQLPLVHDDYNPGWERWFQAAGLVGERDTLPGDRYRDTGVLIAAALDGQAAILVRRLLALDDLKAGRLVQLSGRSLGLDPALYFVCRKGEQTRPAVRIFHDWLRAQMAAAARPD
ncbi:MAG: LysR substrate-binding domain-containing protein [Pseudomonadota bacterium]